MNKVLKSTFRCTRGKLHYNGGNFRVGKLVRNRIEQAKRNWSRRLFFFVSFVCFRQNREANMHQVLGHFFLLDQVRIVEHCLNQEVSRAATKGGIYLNLVKISSIQKLTSFASTENLRDLKRNTLDNICIKQINRAIKSYLEDIKCLDSVISCIASFSDW